MKKNTSGGKVLVIEGDAGTARVIRQILSDHGETVILAETVAAARSHLDTNEVDAILLESVMPEGESFPFVEELGARGVHAPIVLITGEADLESASRAIASGAYDFLEKPLGLERVVLTTTRAVESGRLLKLVDELRGKPRETGEEPAFPGWNQPPTLREARQEWEKRFIFETLEQVDGAIAIAAERLGVEKSGLYRKLRTWGWNSEARR